MLIYHRSQLIIAKILRLVYLGLNLIDYLKKNYYIFSVCNWIVVWRWPRTISYTSSITNLRETNYKADFDYIKLIDFSIPKKKQVCWYQDKVWYIHWFVISILFHLHITKQYWYLLLNKQFCFMGIFFSIH